MVNQNKEVCYKKEQIKASTKRVKSLPKSFTKRKINKKTRRRK